MTGTQLGVVLIATGALAVLFGSATYRATGPGSGFKGYTTGHRIKMAILVLSGLASIAFGAWALLELR